MKKKLAFVLVALFIFVCAWQLLPQTGYAADLTGTTNVISGVTIAKADGSPLGTHVAKDEDIRLTYTFSIPNTSNVHAGDTYTLTVPQQILIATPVPFTITDTVSGALIGNGLMNTNGTITITFTDFASQYSNVHGSFWFELQFNDDNIGNTSPENIIFDIGGTSDPVVIPVDFEQPAPPVATIQKSGSLTAANEITWTITADPENVAISNVQVEDVIPSGLEFINGSVTINGAAADSADYAYDGGTSTFTYTFPADITAQQVITFKTKVADSEFSASTQGATLTKTNSATLRHDGTTAASNTASVDVPVNFISKNGSYDAANKKISWVITVNQVGISIPNAVLTDTLPADLTLDAASVTVDGVSTMSYTYDAPTSTFTYNFGPISEPHTVAFTTSVNPAFYNGNETRTFTNSAKLAGTNVPGNTTSAKGIGVTSSLVNKQGSSYDRTTGQITWTVVVDGNLVSINDAVITDIIEPGQSFVSGSVTINGSAATEGVNYTFDGPTKTLTYTLPPTISTAQTITFKTQVTDPAVYMGNASIDYHNKAKLTGSNITTSESTGTQNVLSQVIDKTGTNYNYQTRELSWRITVDANQMPLDDVVVTDNIPIGQQYVLGSAAIDGGAAGSFSYADADPDDPVKSGTLTYTFTGGIIQTYNITFKTTLTDLSVFATNGDKTVQNSATLAHEEVPAGVTATGSRIIHNTVIGKSASYTAGNQYIDWSISINTNSIPLITSQVTDQLPAGLAMDTTSIKLYHQNISAAGTATMGAEIPLTGTNVVYSLSTRTLNFFIPEPVSGSYLLTFRTDVTDKTKSPFVNQASFSGTGTIQSGTSQSIAVAWSGSGSAGAGEVGSINVIKADSNDTDIKLPGAVFALIDKYGNVVQEQTTDAAGSALFSRIRYDVDYIIREITPPNGYQLGEDYTFQIRNTDSNKNISYTYMDDPVFGSIRFTKTDGANPLAGAVFTLYGLSDTTFSSPLATASSGSNGIVLFQNVPYGEYAIKETTAPTGYFASGAVLTATIADNGVTVTPSQSTVVNAPYLGSIRLTKISDYNSNPLAGAVFTLYKQADTTFSTPIATAATDSTGLAEFESVPFGDYAIKETTPPTGYFASSAVLTASITANGEIAWANPDTVSDQPYLGDIRVVKISSYSGHTLAGCTFSLFSADDTAFSSPLATATSGPDGTATFRNIPYGNYKIKETDPPTGYFISDAVLTASITQNGQTVATNPATIADSPYMGNIQLTKTAGNGQTRLLGATFSLYSASDTAFSAPLATAVSDANGLVRFTSVPYGSYTIKETSAPAGYQLNYTVLQAQITQDGQTVDAGTVSDQEIPPEAKSPKTGDNIVEYALLLAVCLVLIGMILYLGKKTKYKRN